LESLEFGIKIPLFFHFFIIFTLMQNGYLRAWLLAIMMFVASFMSPIFAQNWEVGTTIGGSLYNGDIDVTMLTAKDALRFGGGIFVRYHINHLFAVRLQGNAGTLFADEKQFGSSVWKKKRGFSFTSPIYEIAILPELRPIRIGNVEPFGFIGLGFAAFSPTTNYNDPNPTADLVRDINDRIAIDKNTTFAKSTLSIPIGGGFQWFVNDQFAIGAEVGGRKTFSDYFDQISIAGGATSKDFYFFGGVTFSFLFGGGDGFSGDWKGNGSRKGGGVRCPNFN
jgi:Outer membrane protein beta-barrel domain